MKGDAAGLDFDTAARAVARHARRTPLLRAPALSERLGREVVLKAECLQHTGSFKVRGAAARLEALDTEERARGVVTCSSGNHGRAVAFVAARMGVRATIHVPEWVDPVKLEAIRAAGAEAVCAGRTYDEAETLALARARAEGRTYVSAFDDPWVIAGQGTVALEVVDELHTPPAAVVVPLSGGGLVGGIAAALAWRREDGADRLAKAAPPTRVVAASAAHAAVMLASLRAGHPVELAERETLANALAGGIGLDNRHSFALVRDRVDAHVEVSEDALADAMRYALTRLRLVVEGGGAVGLAALLSCAVDAPWLPADPGPIVVVVSGGNVSRSTLARLLS